MFVLPFVLMMFVELSQSFLCLFDGAWGLPWTHNYREILQISSEIHNIHFDTKLNVDFMIPAWLLSFQFQQFYPINVYMCVSNRRVRRGSMG